MQNASLCYFYFLAVLNSSIGNLVHWSLGWSVSYHLQSESSQHYRVTLETCDLSDILLERWFITALMRSHDLTNIKYDLISF